MMPRSSKHDGANELAKGQVWKTPAGYIEILQLGVMLLDYRMMSQLGKKQVRRQTSPIQAMQDYLRTHKARLVGRDDA